jgi:hypothetical protein
MGTAKAIHTPVRRTRDEPATPPTVPMKAAALNLALLLVGNLQLRPWDSPQASPAPAQQEQADAAGAGAGADEQGSSGAKQRLDAAVAAVRGRSGHYLRLAEELAQVLFDSRRHYCHLLVLNYFSALGGMQVRGGVHAAVTNAWAAAVQCSSTTCIRNGAGTMSAAGWLWNRSFYPPCIG